MLTTHNFSVDVQNNESVLVSFRVTPSIQSYLSLLKEIFTVNNIISQPHIEFVTLTTFNEIVMYVDDILVSHTIKLGQSELVAHIIMKINIPIQDREQIAMFTNIIAAVTEDLTNFFLSKDMVGRTPILFAINDYLLIFSVRKHLGY